MTQPAPARLRVQFGPFLADLRTGELHKFGTRIKLQDRPFEILAMLLERPGEVVTREEIRSRLWPDGTFVDFDNNISSAVGKLRAALADSAATPRYVDTVGRGYRFIAPVELAAPGPAEVPESSSPVAVDGAISDGARARRLWMGVAAAAMVLVVIAAAYVQWKRPRASTPPPSGKIMIAVLPFANLTGDAAQEYFSDGFTEEMITQLGRFDPAHLGVIARTSVMTYKDHPEPLDRVGRELAVQYVLEGSVRREADHLRITAQLIQVSDQTHIFAREYDREARDLLGLQAEIANEIADEIQPAIGDRKKSTSARSAPLSPQTLEAYDLYLKGLFFWNQRSPAGFQQALKYFQQSIDKDPNYAPPYAGMADCYALMSSYFLGPQSELMPKARDAALKALAIDESLAEAHTSLALISENYSWDWQTADKEFRRAIELNPNYSTAHHWYAELLAFEGRFNEALAESERAEQLDPLSLIIKADRGAIYYYARDYQKAISQLRSVRDMNPHVSRAEGLLTMTYTADGQFDDALKVADYLDRTDVPGWGLAHRAHALSRAGQQSRALKTLARAELAMRAHGFDVTAMMATMYSGIGEKEQAFAWLEKARQNHSSLMTTLKVDPVFDPIRGDPRFQDLLRSVGFSQ